MVTNNFSCFMNHSFAKPVNSANEQNETINSRWSTVEERKTPSFVSDKNDPYHDKLENMILAYSEKLQSLDSSDESAAVALVQSLMDDICYLSTSEKLKVSHQLTDTFPASVIGYLCTGQIYEMQGNSDYAIQTYRKGIANTTLLAKDIVLKRLRNVPTVDFAATLPFEILEYLLCLLEPADRLNCLSVSRLWRDRIADCPVVWRQVIVEEEADIPTVELVLNHVRELQIQLIDDCNGSQCLDWIIDGYIPKLEMLLFRQLNVDLPLPNQFLDAFHQAQDTLTELQLFFEWDDEGPSFMSVLTACPKLTHLVYFTSDPNGLSGNDIHPLTPCALTHLRLNCSQRHIIETAELLDILFRCQQLQYFDVKPCEPTASDIIQQACQHLEHLRCNSTADPNPTFWKSISRKEQGNGSQLRSLSMTGYGNMTARNVMPVLESSKETLEELCLIDDRQYGRHHAEWWDPLVNFASNRLQRLEFSIDHHTHVLPAIIRQCPNLQIVNLVQFASDGVFDSLLTLSNLRQLTLSGNCRRMTEAGFMEFLSAISASTSLHKIELSGLESVVTDTSILLLANISNLRELKLGFCWSLSVPGLDAFLWRMKQSNLECLSLYLMDSLTDSGLTWLGQLPRIHKITLEMCNFVTDTGVQHLMEDLRGSLKLLRVHLCDEVSAEMTNTIDMAFSGRR